MRKSAIKIKRVYEGYEKGDGFRILVDRLWPRGIAKEKAKIDLWLKEIAPSNKLRKWFSHDPSKWNDFKKKYFSELESKKGLLVEVKKRRHVTLLYAARDENYNNAVALKEYIKKWSKR